MDTSLPVSYPHVHSLPPPSVLLPPALSLILLLFFFLFLLFLFFFIFLFSFLLLLLLFVFFLFLPALSLLLLFLPPLLLLPLPLSSLLYSYSSFPLRPLLNVFYLNLSRVYNFCFELLNFTCLPVAVCLPVFPLTKLLNKHIIMHCTTGPGSLTQRVWSQSTWTRYSDEKRHLTMP